MYLSARIIVLVLVLSLVVSEVISACLNGCSNRGLCINNACVCAEGLTGSDCSQGVTSSVPTLYQCPTCYAVTVGSPRYVSGPSWRLPDTPIVALNYKGTISVYQGNGDGEMISQGLSIDDYLSSPIVSLQPGTAGNFDSCGAWLMRAFTADSGNVLGFYHAETQCVYTNNGQTRKSSGYAMSADGGKTFTKPNYPNNKILDTATPIILGRPTGAGDLSVFVKGDYYYMIFQNVEDWHFGVARASKASEGYPGSFYNYNNGDWSSPAVGGNSSRLNNIAGTQAYLHTPTQSVVAVGNSNPYWNEGFMLSVSDDVINWTYLADPIITPDASNSTNLDTRMYPSFLGKTGGYDIGSSFQFYYMWVAPWSDWTYRYQVVKDMTLTYVGYNYTLPSTKIALTTFKNAFTGEVWQSTELALPPYQAVDIVGYIMSRPYPYSFVVYDCYNYTTSDHFVGTADECFLSGSGIEVIRTLGYIWSTRVASSIAVYRCYAGNDTFLSRDTNCQGLADPQLVPFGYVMDGPAFVMSQETLISQGAAWKFSNTTVNSTWNTLNFNHSSWATATSPFGNSYSTAVSYFGNTNYYFRYTFNVSAARVVKRLLLSVASDDFSVVYVNGILADTDPAPTHEATYWNRRVYLNGSLVIPGTNVIAIVTSNADWWSYFDCQLVAYYDTSASPTSSSARSVDPVPEVDDPIPEVDATSAKIATKSVRQVPKFVRSVGPRGVLALQTILNQGSNWKFFNKTAPTGNWTFLNYDDSTWSSAPAPFVTGYSAYTNKTSFGPTDYYFRSHFTIAAGQTVSQFLVSIASDNYAIAYINGYLVDSDNTTWHQAAYWNRQFNVPASFINTGDNIIAVVTKNADQWAFFDLQIQVQLTPTASTAAPTVAPTSAPTKAPTSAPTKAPTSAPSSAPTVAPTSAPTKAPTSAPSSTPTVAPTSAPISVTKAPGNLTTAYLLPKGSSWLYYNSSTPASTWVQPSFDDSHWNIASAPFVTGYAAYSGKGTPFGTTNYYFRQDFTVPVGNTVSMLQVSVASDNSAMVWINGVLVDSDTTTWHQAAYWNRQFYVNNTIINSGLNTIAVVVYNQDPWAFFDAQIYAEYKAGSGSGQSVCGIHGQMQNSICTCDSGWGGSDCNTNLCTYTSAMNQTVVASGSSYRNIQWPSVATTPLGWFAPTYDDSWWQLNSAPFATAIGSYSDRATTIGAYRRLYRKKFLVDIPYNMVIQSATLSIASEDVHRILVNGKFVDSPIYPYMPHYVATKWNTVLSIDGSLFSTTNVVAVEIPLVDSRWTSYFDMQITFTFAVKTCIVIT